MISPNMILRPLYHIENENQSQNPAHSIVSNSLFFGTVKSLKKLKKNLSNCKCMNFDKFELNANVPNGAGPCLIEFYYVKG